MEGADNFVRTASTYISRSSQLSMGNHKVWNKHGEDGENLPKEPSGDSMCQSVQAGTTQLAVHQETVQEDTMDSTGEELV